MFRFMPPFPQAMGFFLWILPLQLHTRLRQSALQPSSFLLGSAQPPSEIRFQVLLLYGCVYLRTRGYHDLRLMRIGHLDGRFAR